MRIACQISFYGPGICHFPITKWQLCGAKHSLFPCHWLPRWGQKDSKVWLNTSKHVVFGNSIHVQNLKLYIRENNQKFQNHFFGTYNKHPMPSLRGTRSPGGDGTWSVEEGRTTVCPVWSICKTSIALMVEMFTLFRYAQSRRLTAAFTIFRRDKVFPKLAMWRCASHQLLYPRAYSSFQHPTNNSLLTCWRCSSQGQTYWMLSNSAQSEAFTHSKSSCWLRFWIKAAAKFLISSREATMKALGQPYITHGFFFANPIVPVVFSWSSRKQQTRILHQARHYVLELIGYVLIWRYDKFYMISVTPRASGQWQKQAASKKWILVSRYEPSEASLDVIVILSSWVSTV